MDDSRRTERLASALAGSGASVANAFGVWAHETAFSDRHLEQLDGWADLRYLVADGSRITDYGLPFVCRFRHLEFLSIGNTAITARAIAEADLPPTLQTFGIYGIEMPDFAVAQIVQCRKLVAVNANNCSLAAEAVAALASLPMLRCLEAMGSATTAAQHAEISAQHPEALLRLDDGLWRGGTCRPYRRDDT